MTIQSAITALKPVLGDALSLSKSDRDIHGGSETYFPLTPPDAVAYPQSTDDVARIVSICAEHDCPLIGWGTGTSLEGNTLPVRGGVTVDFSRMNNVLEVNAEDMDVRVQPGVTREQLNEELRATGLFFPVDPGANASLGGMASTRASGTTAVRYGTMRDNVVALEVVLADGQVIRTGTRARKSSAGYDLTGMFVGSEGTLGLITELTLKLQGIPETVAAGVARFQSLEDAVNAVIATIQMGIPMARIEFVDAMTARAVNAYSGTDLPEAPHLMLEFHGSEVSVAEDLNRLREIFEDFDASDIDFATASEDRNRLWQMRHDAYFAAINLRPGAGAVVTDVCVPISKLAEAVSQTQVDIEAEGLLGPILGHVGDGNFHAILLVDRDDPEDISRAKKLAERMGDRALKLGGTITGEHGIGMGKLGQMESEHGGGWDVMSKIKVALDPAGIMNPGKVVRGN